MLIQKTTYRELLAARKHLYTQCAKSSREFKHKRNTTFNINNNIEHTVSFSLAFVYAIARQEMRDRTN